MSERLFDVVDFGQRIHARMCAEKLSYRKLEEKIGVNYNTIFRLVNSATSPSVESYLRLVKWLRDIPDV